MFITIPGEQKPHCVPPFSANCFCTGCIPSRVFPIPSTVVIDMPSHAARGRTHELTGTYLAPITKQLFHNGSRTQSHSGGSIARPQRRTLTSSCKLVS